MFTDEAAKLANVSEARIRRWAKSYPAAMPVRARDHGRPLYRLGDVVEVEYATRKGARLRAS